MWHWTRTVPRMFLVGLLLTVGAGSAGAQYRGVKIPKIPPMPEIGGFGKDLSEGLPKLPKHVPYDSNSSINDAWKYQTPVEPGPVTPKRERDSLDLTKPLLGGGGAGGGGAIICYTKPWLCGN